MSRMKLAAFAALSAGIVAVTGCSTTTDAQQTREVSPDGKTATQTRSRMRETPSGTMVKETETQKREVMSPSTKKSGPADATQRDPGR